MRLESTPPQCAVCGRQVDKFEWWRDPVRDVMLYRASCHGDSETVELRCFDLEDAISIEVLKAFYRKALK
jgi:hypothetical protein